MTLALLFPGQGVQHAGMLPWLDAEPLAVPVLDAMAQQVGEDWRARCADVEWRSHNRVAQPLIVGTSLAAWQALAPRLPRPSVVAGYSVGEIAACAAAGVFDAEAALAMVAARAAAMDASASAAAGGLLSVIGLDAASVEALGTPLGLFLAIAVAPDRCVIGGPALALEAAQAALAAAGAKVERLPIEIASHTPMMNEAAQAFARNVEAMVWRGARSIVVGNVDGAGRRSAADLKLALARQVARTVRWQQCMDTVAERRPACVLEIGPGTSLARIWAARHPDIPVRSIDDFRAADAIVAWVVRCLAG